MMKMDIYKGMIRLSASSVVLCIYSLSIQYVVLTATPCDIK